MNKSIETYRSFETIYEQEEHILDSLQQRIQTLEPVSNDTAKLQRMGKTVTVKTYIYIYIKQN